MDFSVDWTTRIDWDVIRRVRLERIQAVMREQQLDGILTFRAENIRYATNMRPLWWPINFTGRNCALIPAEGDPVLYVTSGDWARCQQTMYWLPKDNIRPCGTMDDAGIAHTMVTEEFIPTAKALGFAGGRIGVDSVNVHIFQELEAGFPRPRSSPATTCSRPRCRSSTTKRSSACASRTRCPSSRMPAPSSSSSPAFASARSWA